MMLLELRFLAGRYHATPWGRHPNEAAVEWPPSPFRILRALLDAYFRKGQGKIPKPVVDRALRALGRPPSFYLPRARASHTRSYLSQNKEDPSDKKLVFDGFVVVDREEPVLVGWDGVTLDGEAFEALVSLATGLSYLGRSESWVAARWLDPRAIQWNCFPLGEGAVPAGHEVAFVAGVINPERYDERPMQVPEGKRKKTLRSVPWIDALTWGSGEAIEHAMNRPPALEPVYYLRRSDALDARGAARALPERARVEVVRYALESVVPVPRTDALKVAETTRGNAMGAVKRVLGDARESPTLSGKDEHGEPLKDHVHVSYLPLDEDGDGYLDHLLVVSPTRPLEWAEQHALDSLRPLPRSNGFPVVLTPVQFGTRESLLHRARVVESHTPFAPTRYFHPNKDGDLALWLARQVTMECERHGLPKPTRIVRVERPSMSHRSSRWLDFRRARKDDAPRPAFGLRLEFAEEVLVPFSIGYACHFGLGTFVPASAPGLLRRGGARPGSRAS